MAIMLAVISGCQCNGTTNERFVAFGGMAEHYSLRGGEAVVWPKAGGGVWAVWSPDKLEIIESSYEFGEAAQEPSTLLPLAKFSGQLGTSRDTYEVEFNVQSETLYIDRVSYPTSDGQLFVLRNEKVLQLRLLKPNQDESVEMTISRTLAHYQEKL